jgi:solute:Na+ symporter, SSS family
MVYGSYLAYGVSSATVHHFAADTTKIPGIDQNGYIAVTALVLNLAVAIVLTLILRLRRSTVGRDLTTSDDYLVDSDVAVTPTFELEGIEPREAAYSSRRR